MTWRWSQTVIGRLDQSWVRSAQVLELPIVTPLVLSGDGVTTGILTVTSVGVSVPSFRVMVLVYGEIYPSLSALAVMTLIVQVSPMLLLAVPPQVTANQLAPVVAV